MSNAEAFNVTTPTVRKIVVTHVFDPPRRLVFKAWTNQPKVPATLDVRPRRLDHARLRKSTSAPAAYGISSGATPMAKKWREVLMSITRRNFFRNVAAGAAAAGALPPLADLAFNDLVPASRAGEPSGSIILSRNEND
jgi:hypothetical protein